MSNNEAQTEYACRFCDRVFQSPKQLRGHERVKHDKEPLRNQSVKKEVLEIREKLDALLKHAGIENAERPNKDEDSKLSQDAQEEKRNKLIEKLVSKGINEHSARKLAYEEYPEGDSESSESEPEPESKEYLKGICSQCGEKGKEHNVRNGKRYCRDFLQHLTGVREDDGSLSKAKRPNSSEDEPSENEENSSAKKKDESSFLTSLLGINEEKEEG